METVMLGTRLAPDLGNQEPLPLRPRLAPLLVEGPLWAIQWFTVPVALSM